ncbi:MAG: pyruvate kinase alpha/beta domain-containing protein [Candidatus Abyssubacteria bacterium]
MRKMVDYFEKPGPENTARCLEIARQAVLDGMKHVVVATTLGDTGAALAEALTGTGVNMVAVTHSAGFKLPGQLELTEENRKRILSAGARIYTGTILTHSLETSLATQFQGVYPTTLIALALRRLGQGIKVVCEIVMEACDAGLIPEQTEVVAVAGTGRGADTVAILLSAASKRFHELKVLEILAKPRA